MIINKLQNIKKQFLYWVILQCLKQIQEKNTLINLDGVHELIKREGMDEYEPYIDYLISANSIIEVYEK
jgi:hypothetical protein